MPIYVKVSTTGGEVTKRSSTTNTLSGKIRAALKAAGISSAEWEKSQLVKGGVTVMLSGNAVEVDYIDPHGNAEYRAATERMMSVLNKQFHNKRMELEGRTFRLSVEDATTHHGGSCGYIHVIVYMTWISST